VIPVHPFGQTTTPIPTDDPPPNRQAESEAEPVFTVHTDLANKTAAGTNVGVAVRSAPLDPPSRELGLAAALLMGVTLAIIVVFGLLLGWYVVRRGRLLRERIPPPRVIEPLRDPNADLDQPTADGPVTQP